MSWRYGDSDGGMLAIVAARRLPSGCGTFLGWKQPGQSGPVCEQDFDLMRRYGLLSRLRRWIGMAGRMTPTCAAILKADGSMAGNGIDVMMCRSETVDGWRSAVRQRSAA